MRCMCVYGFPPDPIINQELAAIDSNQAAPTVFMHTSLRM